MTVAVIGGAGHVGIPLCLVLADHGHRVVGIDKNETAVNTIMGGTLPFLEEQGQELLTRVLAKGMLTMTTERAALRSADVIIITVGTPVDANLGPDFSDLLSVIDSDSAFIRPGQLIMLRSTVAPRTTELIRRLLERKTGLRVGRDLFLAYAPERVAQGASIVEIQELPQLIGAFDEESHERAERFFATFLRERCFRLPPLEAELGKLITNTARYVEFALANEFYLIAQRLGANIYRTLDACTYHYPRLRLHSPGANVGGPCLFKDGWLLVEGFPFPEMVASAFKVNEGMTAHIVDLLDEFPGIHKVAILGLTYKAGSDDTRNSLSFRLKKQLLRRGCEIAAVDPYVPKFASFGGLDASDAVVLMTPHQQFGDLCRILDAVGNDDCVYVDTWGFWKPMRYVSRNGVFSGSEARRHLVKTAASV